jgi:hypothetical protein
MLPSHGKIECRKCFTDSTKINKPHPEWSIVNDPGAWGNNTPKYLVLGFSKGSTQANAYDQGAFNDVAFARMRPRLTAILQKLGLLKKEASVDSVIADPKGDFAFGSLIRCSVSRFDKKLSTENKKVYACTGPLISKSFSEIPDVIDRCVSEFLLDLPDRTRIVFFLGNTDSYVKSCQALIKNKFTTDFKQINPMVVWANNRYWINLAHPSGTNGHFNNWLNSDDGPGIKRVQAEYGVKLSRDRLLA